MWDEKRRGKHTHNRSWRCRLATCISYSLCPPHLRLGLHLGASCALALHALTRLLGTRRRCGRTAGLCPWRGSSTPTTPSAVRGPTGATSRARVATVAGPRAGTSGATAAAARATTSGATAAPPRPAASARRRASALHRRPESGPSHRPPPRPAATCKWTRRKYWRKFRFDALEWQTFGVSTWFNVVLWFLLNN